MRRSRLRGGARRIHTRFQRFLGASFSVALYLLISVYVLNNTDSVGGNDDVAVLLVGLTIAAFAGGVAGPTVLRLLGVK